MMGYREVALAGYYLSWVDVSAVSNEDDDKVGRLLENRVISRTAVRKRVRSSL